MACNMLACLACALSRLSSPRRGKDGKWQGSLCYFYDTPVSLYQFLRMLRTLLQCETSAFVTACIYIDQSIKNRSTASDARTGTWELRTLMFAALATALDLPDDSGVFAVVSQKLQKCCPLLQRLRDEFGKSILHMEVQQEDVDLYNLAIHRYQLRHKRHRVHCRLSRCRKSL